MAATGDRRAASAWLTGASASNGLLSPSSLPISRIAGTPKTVIPKLRRILEATRPGIMALWGSDGNVSHEDTKTCIRLLGQEVLPAMREIGQELGLNSPFEADAPVSHAEAARRSPVAATV